MAVFDTTDFRHVGYRLQGRDHRSRTAASTSANWDYVYSKPIGAHRFRLGRLELDRTFVREHNRGFAACVSRGARRDRSGHAAHVFADYSTFHRIACARVNHMDGEETPNVDTCGTR